VEPATNFRQQDPHEGEPASQRTEIRLLFDDEALYIGARMFDSLGAAGVRTGSPAETGTSTPTSSSSSSTRTTITSAGPFSRSTRRA